MYWKEIGVFGEDKGFHSVTHPSSPLHATLHLWEREHLSYFGIIFTHILFYQRGESYFEGSNDSIFGDLCQRGRKHEPKAKGPHHHLILKWFSIGNFKLVSYYVQKGEKVVFQNQYPKTLLNTKRRISFRVSFVQSKEKHLKQGEKVSKLENALQNLIHLPLTICKRTLKRIYKRICKNKTCGASVVQNFI